MTGTYSFLSLRGIPAAVIFILLILSALSCEPLSLPDAPKNYNAVAYIDSFVTPDTVAVNEPIVMQLNYENMCGGTFLGVRVDKAHFLGDIDSGRVTFTPVVNVNPDVQCGAPLPSSTTSDTFFIASPGPYRIVTSGAAARGENGLQIKRIWAFSTNALPNNFHFHFLFNDIQAQYFPLRQARFRLPDLNVDLRIQADSSGVWDTVFTNAASQLRYMVDSASFIATRGVKQSGIFVIRQ